MKNTKKLLSLALTLALLLSAVFCTGAVATAEGETTTPSVMAEFLTHSTTEADMDWSILGQNLIPDSTVAEWTQDAETSEWAYKNYYAEGSTSTVANANAWWGSKSLSNSGYEGPGVKGYVTHDDSHTNDGSGSLYRKALNGWLYLPLRQMGASYYIVTFWIKTSADSSCTGVIMNDWGGECGKRLEISTTTNWKRVTILTYANADGRAGKFFELGNWSKVDIYIDDFEQYKVSTEYAEACIAAGNKLLNGKETYTSSDNPGATAVTIASDFNFSFLGNNLAPDPTVAAENFADDGTGKMVYSDSGIYSKVLFSNDAAMWKSPKYHNAPVYEPENSHTNDGSGVLKYVMTNSEGRVIRLTTGSFDAHSYYLVTAWVKSSIAGVYKHHIRYDYGTGNVGSFTTTWTRISYIVYTGKYNLANGLQLYLNSGSTAYVDDIAVYRLDAKYGSTCKSKTKLLTEEQYAVAMREADTEISSTTVQFKISPEYTSYTPIDTESLGKNLVTDPTVADWNGETYNSTGWWTKVPFVNSNSVYGSMYTRGYLTNDTTKSHTNDGSGAIAVPGSTDGTAVYLPLTLPNKKTYYLVTMWVHFDESKDVQSGFYTTGSTLNGMSKQSENFKGWRQIAWIVYQGANAISNPSMCLWSKSDFVFDEFSIYELDYEFGKKCMDARTWVAGGTTAAEAKTMSAGGITTLPVTDGYFIPYGAVATATGTMAEKLGNGQFYAKTAGDYKYTEFKYPTGTVGTFGASKKTGDDNAENNADKSGIQFGSLITDTQDVTGSGTLVIRGDFEAFRKTLPTMTRAQILNVIYNRLVNGGVASGKAAVISNGGKSITVMYATRETYMWKNSANTELQYAVRVFGVATEQADTTFTAVGYAIKDGKVQFSNEIKSAVYSKMN